MAWNKAVVTNSGLELLTRCVLGGSVEITSAVGGESVSPTVSLLAVKEIAEPNHVLQVAKIDRLENGVRVNVRAQNTGLSTGYRLRQIGLFARTEGSGETPVLLALIQDKDGEEIPAEEENPEFLLEYDFVIPLSNAENISVSVTPDTFATLDDLEPMNAHIKDKGNPHGVTKAQVGLGNVPNVTTNDQTPTYTVSAALAELASGEKLGTVLGKLAKAVKELIAHLADNVRHITASERASWNGKANGTHGHSEATQSAGGFMSAADKTKLDGIATGANKYTLPLATASARGGVKIGYTANGKNYPVQLSNEQMYVNVPWTDNNTTYSAATQSANGLMSAADKKKLDGIATGANAYSHSTSTGNKHIPAGGASGQILRWSADGTAEWGADNNTTYSNMTAATASAAGKAGLVPAPAAGAQAKYLRGDGTWQTPPDTNTTYSAATQSANGLMSAADKTKLDGIATGANKYTHPSTAGNKHIPAGGASGQILRWSADGTAAWGSDNNTTYSAATQSANGLMSAADKTKLDGITVTKVTQGSKTYGSSSTIIKETTVTIPHRVDVLMTYSTNKSSDVKWYKADTANETSPGITITNNGSTATVTFYLYSSMVLTCNYIAIKLM